MGDNMDRAEFDRIKQMENEILRGRPVGSVTNGGYGKPNGLTPEQTIGFINKQSANDAEWKAVKAFYNGSWNMLERGVLGSLAMLRDNNIESLKAQGIEVGDGGKYIDMALNSDHLQPYDVKGNTQLGQLGLDLAQGAGQLASQAALAVTTGGIGSTLAMGASIAGNQYADLRREGVPVDRATRASVMNAGIQAPLERLSIGNILSKLPAGSGLRQKVVQIAQNAITEGVTEYVQQYPEEITNIYAKNGGNIEELANKTLEQLPEIHRNGLYAGLIGAVLGGGAGAINVAVRRNVNAAQLEAVENRVEQAKKSGITPEAYANTVNNNMPESTVSVDGDVLLGWMQSGNADEMAQMLGVTVNEVQQAADEGLTVELAQGSYEGAAMKYADFLPAMRDHTAFEVGGFMQSDAPGQRELQKEYQSFDDTEAALQAQIDAIAESMQQAGMNAQQRAQAVAALTSYARTQRPDNPASLFEEYPITFRRGADGSVGFEQSAMKRSTAKNIAEFGQEIKDNPLPSKTGFWFTTQSGDEITIPGSNYVHIQDGKHPLSDEQWQNIIDNLENVEYAVTDNAKGHHTGIPVQIKIDTPIGKAGVSLEFLSNGRVLLTTAAYNNDAAIDNWLKNKKNSRTLGVASYKDPNRIPGSPSLLQSIKDELGIVNKYNQSAYHGTPHSFDKFDLGAIGTGEGNQAHGWGLYFAADRKIAKEYQERLSRTVHTIKFGDETYFMDLYGDWINKSKKADKYITYALNIYINSANGDMDFVKNEIAKRLESYYLQYDLTNPEVIKEVTGFRNVLNDLNKNNFVEMAGGTGNLFEVDIPENDVLLDEDLPYTKQPPKVKKALQKLFKDKGFDIDFIRSAYSNKNPEGKALYMEVQSVADGTPESASKLLNEYGIKGITYEGWQDGRCFVVFDDKAISIINRYNQSANEGNRGSIYWNNEGQAIVQLFEAADASTFIHEATGHYFANVLAKEAAKVNAPEQIVKDFNTMLDYAGTTRERWDYLNSKPRHQLTEAEDKEIVKIQETWATAAEQYFLEGKAPNRELQPVFNRFKKWLLGIYKSVEQFVQGNKYAVPITDEVRQVFDRMLASEQQITEMEKLNGYYAKLPSVITDNLSDRYKTLLYNKMAQAHDKAVQLLTAKSLENFTAERKERIQRYREEMRPKVAEAVDNEPLYTASRQLLEDNSKYKDVKAYVNHYYDLLNRSTDIEAKPLTEAEETEVMTFDLTAETNGFESGDALAKAILESPTRQQAITQRLNDEVQKRFPDIYKERRLAEAAAQEAFYNDDTGEVLGLEEQIIEDAAKKTLDQQRSAEQQRQLAQMKRQQAKVQAQGYLRSVTLREALQITKYVTAERRAAANAATALAKGDYDTALDYKHKQLLAHQMVQESINMNRRYAQYGKFLNRQRKMKKENWGNEENFMQVGALLARMGLRLRGYDERLKQQSLREWADIMQEDYDNVAIADWIYNESRTFTHPLSDLTFDEYEDVVNALKNIRAVVKAQTMMQGEAKAHSFAETKDAGMEALDKLPTKYTPDVNEKGKAKAIDNFARQLRNSDNLFEMLDNWTYGWFSKHFGEAVRRCADVEAELTMKYEDATRQAYKEWLPDKAAMKAANKAVHYDELGTSVNKHTLIKLAINLGNESNAAKLCSTAVNSTYREWFSNSPLWVDDDVIQTKKNLLEFLGRVLTAEDWRYAQKKIDIANMFWQQMSELEYRDKGFRPPKVEAYPEIITLADGQQIVFRGGYFPLIRRRDTGSHPASQDAIPSTTGGRPGDSIRTLHTNTGHTKARDNSIYPIDLTPGGEFAVAMDTIHDIAYRETMNNFRKLMNDREFYNKLKEKLGIADMEALEEFLKKAAQPYGGSGFATLSERDIGTIMNWLRSITVANGIMLNIKVSLQNFGNIWLYGRVVDGFGYRDVLAALGNYRKNWQGRYGWRALNEFVNNKSVFMREREQMPDITLRDIKEGNQKLNPIAQKTTEVGAKILAVTDGFFSKPIWAQAYSKKINEGASEQEAIMFADTVIRRTLGSSKITDVAPILRGGPLVKMLTTFQGFFNTQYNQWNREYNIVLRNWSEGKKKEAAERVVTFATSKFIAICLTNLMFAFENPLDDDDDDGWANWQTEMLHYPISLLGPVGGLGNATLNIALGIKDYDYRMTAVEGSIDKIFHAVSATQKVSEGEKDPEEAIEPIVNLLSTAAGIPNQLNKLFFNAWDILYNDMEAEPRDLFYRRPARER